MGRHRRATDRPPLRDIVTKGNLDDRLETVDTRHKDHLTLAVERWAAHRAVHDVLAEALREYKHDANEWRITLTDLRGSFMPKAEFASEHRALEATMRGEVEKLAGVVAALDQRVDTLAGEVKEGHVEQSARRSVFSDTRNVAVAISLVFGIIASALLLVDRLSP